MRKRKRNYTTHAANMNLCTYFFFVFSETKESKMNEINGKYLNPKNTEYCTNYYCECRKINSGYITLLKW